MSAGRGAKAGHRVVPQRRAAGRRWPDDGALSGGRRQQVRRRARSGRRGGDGRRPVQGARQEQNGRGGRVD